MIPQASLTFSAAEILVIRVLYILFHHRFVRHVATVLQKDQTHHPSDFSTTDSYDMLRLCFRRTRLTTLQIDLAMRPLP